MLPIPRNCNIDHQRWSVLLICEYKSYVKSYVRQNIQCENDEQCALLNWRRRKSDFILFTHFDLITLFDIVELLIDITYVTIGIYLRYGRQKSQFTKFSSVFLHRRH